MLLRGDFVRRGNQARSDILVIRSPFKPGEPAQRLGHLHATADAGDDDIDHGQGRVEVAAGLELLDRHAGGRPSSWPRSGETRGSVRSAGEQ